MEWYFEHIGSGKRYKVVRIERNNEGNPIKFWLKGTYGEFDVPADPEMFRKCGYRKVKA